MSATAFQYLISLAITENLEMRLIVVITTYLFRLLDNDIYMKILEGFKMLEASSSESKEM